MHARRLTTPEEKLQFHIFATTCFHGKMEDVSKKLAELREKPGEDEIWGALTDEGEIQATLVNNHYVTRFDGHEVKAGGIGGVATPPENRYGGAVKTIFAQMLPALRSDGEVFSFLFPFKHSFYRRFGYEICYIGNVYKMKVEALNGFVHTGWVKPYREGDDAAPYMQLWNDFSSKYSLTMVRDEKVFAERLSKNPLKDRRFTYLIGEFDEPLAYVSFSDVEGKERPKLYVWDLAYAGRKGLYALLGFLARFTSDYGELEIRLPEDANLPSIITESPYPPEFLNEPHYNYMGRVMNAPEALRLMSKPDDCRFVITVEDEHLPANSGTYLVTNAGVEQTDEEEDIFVTIQALAPMVLGLSSLRAAQMRPDVEVSKNFEMLDKVFAAKPQYIADFF